MLIELEQAVQALQRGLLVGLPTETVYGLGGIATSPTAMEEIYRVKRRPHDNPLICHFYDEAQIRLFVHDLPPYWRTLYEAFSPGPVSYRFALPKDSPLRPALAGQTTVVCRIPDQPLCLEVIRRLREPLAAPSANTSGKVSPTTAAMVDRDLGPQIAGVLDGGPCEVGLESTILDCCHRDRVTILRPGSVGTRELEDALRRAGFEEVTVAFAENQGAAVVPGAKYRHYAPDRGLTRLTSRGALPEDRPCLILLSMEAWEEGGWPSNARPLLLGSREQLPEVAKTLYRNLKSIDEAADCEAFWWEEEWGESSLGRAIANRLRRASASQG